MAFQGYRIQATWMTAPTMNAQWEMAMSMSSWTGKAAITQRQLWVGNGEGSGWNTLHCLLTHPHDSLSETQECTQQASHTEIWALKYTSREIYKKPGFKDYLY